MPKPPQPPRQSNGLPPRAPVSELLQEGLRLHQSGRGPEAAGYYQRVLDREPAQPAANHLLGVVRLQQGRHDEAIRLIRRAIAAHASDPQYHMNLGVALNGSGKPAEAAEAFRHALALNPNLAGAHSNLGMALRVLGNLDEAAAAYRTATSLAPSEPAFHFNLANILAQLGDVEAAAAAYREALSLRPVYPPAMAGLAQLNETVSRDADTLSRVDQSLATHPDVAEYQMIRGRVLYRLRHLEAATEALSSAIRLNPSLGEARFHLANMTRARSDEAVEPLEHLVADTTRQLDDRVYAGFALGRVFADLDRHEDSIVAYEAANALQRTRLSYSAEAVERHHAELLAPFEGDPARLLGGGHRGPRPIFIVGLPRSGKSTIEAILAQHPAVGAAGELPIFERLVARAGLLGNPEPDPAKVEQVGRDYVAELAAIVGKDRRSVDTMPPNDRLLGYIRAALPDAILIHAVREPVSQRIALFEKFLPRTGYEYARDQTWLAAHLRLLGALERRWKQILTDTLYDVDVGAEPDREALARRLFAICGLDGDINCGAHQDSEPVLGEWDASRKARNESLHEEAWRRLRPEFLNVSV